MSNHIVHSRFSYCSNVYPTVQNMSYNTFKYDFYPYICNENQVIINTDEDTFLLFASYHFTLFM